MFFRELVGTGYHTNTIYIYIICNINIIYVIYI